MNYAGVTTCDICNGEGLGVVLWCQGCDLRCPGCHNAETHDFTLGKSFTEDTMKLLLSCLDNLYTSRLTLSGGHPLAKQNLADCTSICKRVKSQFPDKKIWVYTGYLFEDIVDYEILKYVDVIVDGPFILDEKNIALAFRGSNNQRVIDVKESLRQGSVALYEN